MPISVFISYCHTETIVKERLIKHINHLVERDMVDVFNDSQMYSSDPLWEILSEKISSSQVFICIVSVDYINSTSCKRELEQAKNEGKLIFPLLARQCDWNWQGLQENLAFPKDGSFLADDTNDFADKSLLDQKLTDASNELEGLCQRELDKTANGITTLTAAYEKKRYLNDQIRHSSVTNFDDRLILIEPSCQWLQKKGPSASLKALSDALLGGQTAILQGVDKSGKTTSLKILQSVIVSNGHPCIIINADAIRNVGIETVIKKHIEFQMQGSHNLDQVIVLIDDLEKIGLPLGTAQSVLEFIISECKSLCATTFGSSVATYFASDNLPDPYLAELRPLNQRQIFELTLKWTALSSVSVDVQAQFSKLYSIVSQSGLDQYPYFIIQVLQIIETYQSDDIRTSSYASCFDRLLRVRLDQEGVKINRMDLYVRFLGYISYQSYLDNKKGFITIKSFDSVVSKYQSEYLVDFKPDKDVLVKALFNMSIINGSDCYQFNNEYVWYYTLATHVERELRINDENLYVNFISECADDVYSKQSANILIFIGYLSNDDLVVRAVIDSTNKLFSNVDEWYLSDQSRGILLGHYHQDRTLINAGVSVEENKKLLLDQAENIDDEFDRLLLNNAVPFIPSTIKGDADPSVVANSEIAADNYMHAVRALLRLHSVIGHILSSRAGTFKAEVLLESILAMIKASGRYVYINHVFVKKLLAEVRRIESAQNGKRLEYYEDMRVDKTLSLFSFWSVYMAQAGLARFLGFDGAMPALDILENDEKKADHGGNKPFNVASVKIIARIYTEEGIQREAIQDLIDRYGENSGILGLIRVAFSVVSTYKRISAGDIQWLSTKLKMRPELLSAANMRLEYRAKS